MWLIDRNTQETHQVELGYNNRCACPFHGGTNPDSLWVNVDGGGYKCHVCNSHGWAKDRPDNPQNIKYPAIHAKDTPLWGGDDDGFYEEIFGVEKGSSALKPSAPLKPSGSPTKEQEFKPDFNRIVREHVYKDADGNPVYKKVYYRTYNKDGVEGKKTPRQYRYDKNEPNESNRYKAGLTFEDGRKVEQLLYNYNNIKDLDRLLYVEGEKDCDTLISMGIKFVTTLGSATNKYFSNAMVQYFKGKTVIFIPDRDTPGYDCVSSLSQQIYAIAKVIAFCFLQDDKDISDYVARVKPTKQELGTFILDSIVDYEDAKPYFARMDSYLTVEAETELFKYKNYPLSIFPQQIQNYFNNYCEDSNSKVEYIATGFLSGISSALSGKSTVHVCSTWKPTYISYNAVIVGESGTGKSHPIKEGISCLVDINKEYMIQYEQELELYLRSLKSKGAQLAGKPKCAPYIINSGTMEGVRGALHENEHGCLLFAEEMSTIINGLNQYKPNGNDLSVIVGFLDGDSNNCIMEGKKLFVKRPRLTLLTAVQPNLLETLITDTMLDIGFVYRLLFVQQSERKRMKLPDQDKDKFNSSEIYCLYHKADEMKDFDVRFSPGAYKRFQYYNDDFFGKLYERYFDKDLIRCAISKLITYIPKISALFCVLDVLCKDGGQEPIPIKSAPAVDDWGLNLEGDLGDADTGAEHPARNAYEIQKIHVDNTVKLLMYHLYVFYDIFNKAKADAVEPSMPCIKIIQYLQRKNINEVSCRELQQSRIVQSKDEFNKQVDEGIRLGKLVYVDEVKKNRVKLL